MEIDRYVRSLRESGQGSGGKISIDLGQALEMTAHLSVTDPDWWVLKFVQAAVAAGARDVRLRFEDDQWLLRHDGEDVGRLSLLDALGKDGARKQMALCLRAAWAEPAAEVALMTHYGGLTRALHWPGDGVWRTLDACPWGDGSATLLVCRWKRAEELSPQRIARFRQAFRLAPARVWLERDCVHEPAEGDRRVPAWLWPAPGLSARSLALAPTTRQVLLAPVEAECLWGSQAESAEPVWSRLVEEVDCIPSWGMVTLTPEVGQHRLRLVHFGVEVTGLQRELPGASSGCQSILTTSGLRLDDLGREVVQDAAWIRRVCQLEQVHQELYRFFARGAPHSNIVRLFKGY